MTNNINGGGGRRIKEEIRKERDDDLLLFKELRKREKDGIATLLQPVSDEFNPSGAGHYAQLYRIASGKKGYEFFPENDKNDYDWLKTPPATPLFPSLEMETNAPQLAVQRQLPIIQPPPTLSRLIRIINNMQFSGNPSEAANASSIGVRPRTPTTKLNNLPLRFKTPNHGTRSISSTETRKSPIFQQKTIQHQQQTTDFITSNLSKTKPKSRGVSPLVRSTIPAPTVVPPGFSTETPSNLRTDRSTSATRGRPPNSALVALLNNQKPEVEPPISKPKNRRQSCSPSVTRGRRVVAVVESKPESSQTAGNGTQFMGSRMVEKVMNARKLSGSGGAFADQGKMYSRAAAGSVNGSPSASGFGFAGMTSKSSPDVALKHMVRGLMAYPSLLSN
ncbi:uncharacterized protein LOC120000026 [Tripterygium wilfordii]|uniref:uncharacterized protein LOC120000026 n=1 Tax=Tripterygium wilfordii TaxID=458696 RepID=UPI0018F85FA3|nr:uncharacterized protein LOC120000026 [Tripterygium wilfordii]